VLVCLVVRHELGAGQAVDGLIVPKVIRAANAAVLLAVLGGLLVAQVQVPDPVILGWLVVLVVGGRGAVQVWSARHRRQSADR
jgi:hypothetical protein